MSLQMVALRRVDALIYELRRDCQEDEFTTFREETGLNSCREFSKLLVARVEKIAECSTRQREWLNSQLVFPDWFGSYIWRASVNRRFKSAQSFCSALLRAAVADLVTYEGAKKFLVTEFEHQCQLLQREMNDRTLELIEERKSQARKAAATFLHIPTSHLITGVVAFLLGLLPTLIHHFHF